MLEALIEQYLTPDSDEIPMVMEGNHPDTVILDAKDKETNTEVVRSVRDQVTSSPAKWKYRYLILTGIDRLHPTALQTLLKLIEEPPEKLKVALTSDNLSGVPSTILSRAVKFPIKPPTIPEIQKKLEDWAIDEPQFRAEVCGGSLHNAKTLDIKILKDWSKLWSFLAAGNKPKGIMVYEWTEKINETATTVETKEALWDLVLQKVMRNLKSGFWRQVADIAKEEREKVRRNKDSKVSTAASMVQIYALLKTAAKVGR